jgi:hypothetical protein
MQSNLVRAIIISSGEVYVLLSSPGRNAGSEYFGGHRGAEIVIRGPDAVCSESDIKVWTLTPEPSSVWYYEYAVTYRYIMPWFRLGAEKCGSLGIRSATQFILRYYDDQSQA